MVQSLITPSGADWDYMSAGPTPAERYVAAWFEERLPGGWEIYVRPYLNGPTPSLVLLHPQYGIAVYEVVDWDPHTVQYTVKTFEASNGKPRDRHILQSDGHPLEGLENPYLLVRYYKNRIARLCTDVTGATSYGLITAGLIFTNGSTRYWEDLLAPFRGDDESKSMNPICGSDLLGLRKVNRILRRAYRNTAQTNMTTQLADLLRFWLLPPGAPDPTGDALILDDTQSALVNRDPGITGYRRVSGPAGSGKSVVLAARAARLALAGQRVLITCFNITLTNYLRELLIRFLWAGAGNPGAVDAAQRFVEIYHCHGWASRLQIDDDRGDCLDTGICNCPADRKFDAVMVDEGQDFEPEWWAHLRLCALANDGEVLFAADVTQDLYGRSKSWTDATKRNAGFRGRWNELQYNYRVPEGIIPVLDDFITYFMPDRAAALPAVAQGELSDKYSLDMRWIQLQVDSRWGNVCLNELQRVIKTLPDGHHLHDIALLFWNHVHGFDFVSAIFETLPIDVSHIFVQSLCDDDQSEGEDVQNRSRPLKLSFPLYEDGLRAITVHSYKGWEARHLLIYVQDLGSTSDGWSSATLFYVALTRLMRDPLGSSLTVVSSCPELAEFGRRHFPNYKADNLARLTELGAI